MAFVVARITCEFTRDPCMSLGSLVSSHAILELPWGDLSEFTHDPRMSLGSLVNSHAILEWPGGDLSEFTHDPRPCLGSRVNSHMIPDLVFSAFGRNCESSEILWSRSSLHTSRVVSQEMTSAMHFWLAGCIVGLFSQACAVFVQAPDEIPQLMAQQDEHDRSCPTH